MHQTEAEAIFAKGVEALAREEWPTALACFERAANVRNTPIHASFLGLCLARERGQVRKAVALCAEAIEQEPGNSLHYLNLGKIYLLQGDRPEAIRMFRKGLERGFNEQIVAELSRLGVRRSPPLPFLSRNNPLNKYLGIILGRLGLRR
jgi:tetratricopeptide (TPR) repeat protein